MTARETEVYEFFDHTADLGLRIVSPDLDGLFRDAAEGFFSVVVEPSRPRGGTHEMELRLSADRLDHLLVDWLNELLYLFDTKQLLLDSIRVAVRGTRLVATARSRPADDGRDRMLHEVKAITYHGLRVERTSDGWLAEVILDI